MKLGTPVSWLDAKLTVVSAVKLVHKSLGKELMSLFEASNNSSEVQSSIPGGRAVRRLSSINLQGEDVVKGK